MTADKAYDRLHGADGLTQAVDHLAAIRARRAEGILLGEDYDWLLTEVDRLQAIIVVAVLGVDRGVHRAEVIDAEREGFGNGVEWARRTP